MRLPYSIAITLSVITCLSSFMLGLGQNDFILPVLMFLAAALSLYVTDFRRLIRLGDWTVNVLVLLIVFFALGDLVRNRGEDLAYAIARVLVFVEMVLLFREKATRFCWQILLISLLQVVVATVLQQSLLFGFLLIAYVFAGMYALLLIFLQRENRYFQDHSFIGTFFDSLRAEIAERQDRGKLVRIALVTLLTGPLSLVFSFTPTQKPERKRDEEDDVPDKSQTSGEILKSLFAVFPPERDRRDREHWQTIEDAGDSERNGGAWYDRLWDRQAPAVEETPAAQRQWVAVPERGTNGGRAKSKPDSKRRFPLLSEPAGFSAGTLYAGGLAGGRRELFFHLLSGTVFALIFAVMLFCLVPRIGKIEFWHYSFSFGHENWTKSYVNPVGTVGFNEEVRLGSLGTVLPYHREVFSVRFYQYPSRSIPPLDAAEEFPYDAIQGASVYFRGVALDHYTDGVWKQQANGARTMESLAERREAWERDERLTSYQRAISMQVPHPLRPGQKVRTSLSDQLFFEEGIDLVGLRMIIQPLDSTVFFAPWPFVCRNDSSLFLRVNGNRIDEVRGRRQVVDTMVFTTAFSRGRQLEIVPCQERLEPEPLLQIPDAGLDALKKMAARWDAESDLPKRDLVGRARYMEQRFLHSEQFRYQLGGTTRRYGMDPLEDFIDNNSAGHCEYFAGALALMLRSVGIGARVIVGFRTEVLRPASQPTTVRQSDAHSWVDVYLPPEALAERRDKPGGEWWTYGGWLRLDPTPASREEQTLIQSFSFSFSDLQEWIGNFWGEFVLNMNPIKQSEWVYEPIKRGFRYLTTNVFNIAFWRNVAGEVFRYYKNLLTPGPGSGRRAVDWFFLALPVVLLFLIALALRRFIRLLLPYLKGASEQDLRRLATIEFYVRMEGLLARLERERRVGETPLEYVRQTGFTETTLPVVDAYYRVRYGNRELTDDELRGVRELLDRLEKHLIEQEAA